MTATSRPPFSGARAVCVKCTSQAASVRFTTARRAMQAPSGRIMEVTCYTDAPDPHLVRTCTVCGWEWEERCADDTSTETTIRERAPMKPEPPALREVTDTGVIR